MELKWLKFDRELYEWNFVLIWNRAEQLVESGVSSNGKDGEWYVDIWGSKVVAPPVSIDDSS
jgi:hypothetical protein